MKSIVFCVLISVFIFLESAYAAQTKSANYCALLSIEITNLTDETCTLSNYVLNQGELNYGSHLQAFITPGSTTSALVLEQSLMGADIDINYQCGPNKTISFKSHQSYCFFMAGSVEGQVLKAKQMNAEFSVSSGSFIWSRQGQIKWTLT